MVSLTAFVEGCSMRKITISTVAGLLAAVLAASPAAAQYGMDKKGPKNAATPELPRCAQPLGRAAIQEPENRWWTELGPGGPAEAVRRPLELPAHRRPQRRARDAQSRG
jgi:hypothetical protein